MLALTGAAAKPYEPPKQLTLEERLEKARQASGSAAAATTATAVVPSKFARGKDAPVQDLSNPDVVKVTDDTMFLVGDTADIYDDRVRSANDAERVAEAQAAFEAQIKRESKLSHKERKRLKWRRMHKLNLIPEVGDDFVGRRKRTVAMPPELKARSSTNGDVMVHARPASASVGAGGTPAAPLIRPLPAFLATGGVSGTSAVAGGLGDHTDSKGEAAAGVAGDVDAKPKRRLLKYGKKTKAELAEEAAEAEEARLAEEARNDPVAAALREAKLVPTSPWGMQPPQKMLHMLKRAKSAEEGIDAFDKMQLAVERIGTDKPKGVGLLPAFRFATAGAGSAGIKGASAKGGGGEAAELARKATAAATSGGLDNEEDGVAAGRVKAGRAVTKVEVLPSKLESLKVPKPPPTDVGRRVQLFSTPFVVGALDDDSKIVFDDAEAKRRAAARSAAKSEVSGGFSGTGMHAHADGAAGCCVACIVHRTRMASRMTLVSSVSLRSTSPTPGCAGSCRITKSATSSHYRRRTRRKRRPHAELFARRSEHCVHSSLRKPRPRLRPRQRLPRNKGRPMAVVDAWLVDHGSS